MTLTREQVIEISRESGALIPDDPSESWLRRQTIALNLAFNAGRARGLGEAKEVCKTNAKRWPDLRGFYVANECAAAIEQLKEKT